MPSMIVPIIPDVSAASVAATASVDASPIKELVA